METRNENENTNLLKSVDWFTIVLYLIMVVAGAVSIYAATYDYDKASMFDLSEFSGKQFLWAGMSLLIGFSLLLIDRRIYEAYAYPLYGFMILLLIITSFVAPDIKGSRSWLTFGSVSLQPAEFAKTATALALAKLFSTYGFSLNGWRNYAIALGIILLPILCIILERETGTALVYTSLIFVLYREGFPGAGWLMVAGVTAILLFIFTLVWSQKVMYIILDVLFALTLTYYLLTKKKHLARMVAVFAMMFVFVFSVDYAFHKVLQEHQQNRILVMLGKLDDPQGVGYNVHQSKIAIGSGGFSGKGFLQGTQTKYDFVPEQHTDFIFCTIGEEGGFLGTATVVLLYVGLLLRIVTLAERQKSTFSRVYGYAIAGIIFMHFFINIGMTIGLMPVIGIPLPFLSYGGSSLLAFTIMLFIFIRLDLDQWRYLEQ